MHPSMIGTINVGCATGIPVQQLPEAGAFPNPFNDQLTVKTGNNDYLQISDMLGRTILDIVVKPGQEKKLVGLEVPQGIYFLHFYSDGTLTETRKLVRQ